ncbi:MAG: putative polyketide biosynthesis zinc-dependent hydrolase BaeB [Candidatus Heimdallarchaeota archaeon LC_3]|nr:MAG: putative polyketide biosynthesis zinc-dependent hydrolase BaeB [Candidatus Heimdallarchaeota archaeon LC_3]
MSNQPSVLEISAQEVYKNFLDYKDQDFIDVRSSEAHNDWNIFGSVNIPFKMFQSGEFKDLLPKSDKPLTIVCNRGNDSKVIAKFLNDNKIKATSLSKGMQAWNNILHPLEIQPKYSKFKIIQYHRIAKGCLSYLVVNNDEAVVIDPVYKIDPYLKYIENNGYELKYIFETHLHADHISGSRLLQEKTGANLLLSNKDPYTFDYTPIDHEKSISLGGESIIFPIHTPGHTKGSTTIKIGKNALLTGDTVFLDSLGRPDLADRAHEFANDLYDSLNNKIANLSNEMCIMPAHHGKVELKDFNKSFETPLSQIKKFDYFKLSKQDFVQKVVAQTNKTEKPVIYQRIIRINSGSEHILDSQIPDLEMGSNKCAISQK